MTKEIYETGIVGCGAHSHVHARAVENMSGMRLTACCDIDPRKAKEWAQKYGCPSAFANLDEMLEKTTLDAVILCTWPVQHAEQIKSCLDRGIKNILCEKSLCLSGAEAVDILDRSTKTKAFVMEACMYRHHPAIRKLEHLVFSGETGAVDSVRAVFSNFEPDDDAEDDRARDWRLRPECGGGVAHDWMSYCVNAANHFCDGIPLRVFAAGSFSPVSNVINRVYALIEYDNGKTGIIESGRTANFSQMLQINCEHGLYKLPVAWGIGGDTCLFMEHRKQEWDYILTDTFRIEHIDPYFLQLTNFLNVIKETEKPVIGLRESVLNAFTIEAIVESMTRKKLVEISLPSPLIVNTHGKETL